MRWERVACLTGLFAAIAAAALMMSLHSAEPRPSPSPVMFHDRPASPAEQGAMLLALVEHKLSGSSPSTYSESREGDEGGAIQEMVVVERTLRFCTEPRGLSSVYEDCVGSRWLLEAMLSRSSGQGGGASQDIPIAFRQALIDANLAALPFVVLLGGRAVLVSKQDFEWLTRDDWRRFQSRYPNAIGALRPNWPVISQDGSEALMYAEYRCGRSCGSGELYRFRFVGGHWTLANAFGIRIT